MEEQTTPDAVESEAELTAAEPQTNPEESSTEGVDQPESDKNLPFHTHPRWQEMLESNNSYKQRVEALEAEIEKSKGIERPQQTEQKANPQGLSPEGETFAELITQKAIEKIKAETQAEREAEARVQELATKAIEDVEKKVGDKELFESSFKPYYRQFVKDFPEAGGNLEAIYRKWKVDKASDLNSKDRTSDPSKPGGAGKTSFKLNRSEDFLTTLERAKQEIT